MTAGRFDFKIEKGSDWDITFVAKDSLGSTVEYSSPLMQIRRTPESTGALIVSITPTVDAGTKKITAALAKTATKMLPSGYFYYDIFALDTLGNEVKLLMGRVTIEGNVSRV